MATALAKSAGAAPSTPVDPPIRVLFADDSAAIRTLARYVLSAQHGFEIVAEAATGNEAVSLYDVHRPDCVVLDIAMPGMDGWEACAHIRSRYPAPAVVMLSGSTDERVTERALSSGAEAYLDKGSQLARLAETVRRAVESVREAVDRSRQIGVVGSASGGLRSVATITETDMDELRRLEYTVGHDLTEPLRVISGFTSLLEERYAAGMDASGQTFLRHVSEASDRMQAMLDEFLVYARAGRMKPSPQVIDVADLIGTVVEGVTAEAADRSVRIDIGALPRAFADPTMLKSVLQQILLNAIRFNTAAMATVRLEGWVEGKTTVITVTDNGIGIAPAAQERAFDLFRRLNTREEYPGVGAGLALCRRLMQAQGGGVTLASPTGEGTTVTLTMPAPAG